VRQNYEKGGGKLNLENVKPYVRRVYYCTLLVFFFFFLHRLLVAELLETLNSDWKISTACAINAINEQQ
jgi:hypothetical protein